MKNRKHGNHISYLKNIFQIHHYNNIGNNNNYNYILNIIIFKYIILIIYKVTVKSQNFKLMVDIIYKHI